MPEVMEYMHRKISLKYELAFCKQDESRHLQIFILSDLLEIDIGYGGYEHAAAWKPAFKVLFDHSGTVEEKMVQSRAWMDNRIYGDKQKKDMEQAHNVVWLFLMHAAVAIRRGNCFQAIGEMEAARALYIDLLGDRFRLESRRNREIDNLPEAEKAAIRSTYAVGESPAELWAALLNLSALVYKELEEIIRQAAKTFKNIHPDKSIGFFYNNKKDTDTDITFALVQTMGKSNYLNDNYFENGHFDYIIIDEFHHAVANNYKRILDYFKPKFLLGLTATPERLDTKDVFALCDYNTVYEIRLKEAINKGFLSPFKYYGIYDDTVNYEDISMRRGRYDEKDLEDKLMINKRADLVLNHYLKYPSKTAIGFCSSRNHAEFMAEHFTKNNIPSAAVYSGEPGEYTHERQTAIAKLKNNELKILFTVDMFNEGVDIPSIDTVLFLRPTQSPIVFLQQLGRGLRKSEDKKYLTVLDFIGNYKKANLVPFLLSGNEYDTKTLLNESVMDFEYPEDCYIDFDFQLVDLFKIQARQELKIKDKIIMEFESVKESLSHRPSRVELFLRMDDAVYSAMRKRSKLNLFRDYITFLSDNNELESDEKSIVSTKAHEFLNALETTSMTKSYKMPIFLAFYNDGEVKMEITDEDVYKSMCRFYSDPSNGVDMLKDKRTRNYKEWGMKEYVSLAKRNPIKFLNKSTSEFFIKKDGCALALSDDLKDYIKMESFIEHFRDIIEYKTLYYYKTRFEDRK